MGQAPAVPTSALEAAGAVTTDTSLQLTDPNLEWDDYENLGILLGRMGNAHMWWVGDFLLFGEQVYGEQYAQIESVLKLAPQTLANRASVARHIPPERRRASLHFSHHAEVAYLDPAVRDRWLDLAESGDWSRSKLREEIRAAREEQSESVGDLAETGTAINGGFLGEPVPTPIHTCPQCGYEFSDKN